jgi:selenophosphate synthetase-related protein
LAHTHFAPSYDANYFFDRSLAACANQFAADLLSALPAKAVMCSALVRADDIQNDGGLAGQINRIS